MKKIYKRALLFLGWACGALVSATDAQAQQEARNWFFGNQAGISFNALQAQPTAVASSAMISYEGCATISTASGQLAMYTNGEKVWDASHQVMPNGALLGGHNSASQSALVLRVPGSASLYYLFTVDAIDNNLVGGLRYSIVDMSLRGGLGDVVSTSKNLRLPTPTLTGKVTEKLTAALHANGRDYWVVVHGWQNNEFYSFLLSPGGISSTPVVSAAGPVHQGGGSFFGAANAVGYMRVSPNGQKLALAQRDIGFELYDFNNATGIVSSYAPLYGASNYCYGIAFSPDNSRLYATGYSDGGYDSQIYQFNLLAGGAPAIQASRTVIGSVSGLCVAIQSGFNGKLYLSSLNLNTLNTIESPNALGAACSFQTNTLSLGQKVGQNGLPNFPNAFSVVPTGVTRALAASLLFYPNPAHGHLSLVWPAALNNKPICVTLTTATGQIVLSRNIIATPLGAEIIPLEGLANGIYALRVSSAGEVVTQKLVVD